MGPCGRLSTGRAGLYEEFDAPPEEEPEDDVDEGVDEPLVVVEDAEAAASTLVEDDESDEPEEADSDEPDAAAGTFAGLPVSRLSLR